MARPIPKKFASIADILKGVANHRRLQILSFVSEHPDLSLFTISEELEADFRTISQHTRRLVRSGLIEKKYQGRIVEHRITRLGKDILTFCRMLE